MYKPIEDYGLIGNMRTAALVGKNGLIHWLCFPNFDSASVFAAILDANKRGRFAVRPADEVVSYKQIYWPETNVLTTRFHCCDGVAEVTDFMPVHDGPERHDSHMLIRKVTVPSGKLGTVVECEPAFDYARDKHDTVITEKGACFHSPELSLGLAIDVPLKQKAGGVAGDFVLGESCSAVFVLQAVESGGRALPVSPERATEFFKETVAYWLRCRDGISSEIIQKGWSCGRQAYVQSYDTDILDAGNLIMPLVFFMSPTDPRMLKTLDATNRPLAAGGLVRNSFVYRFEQAAGGNGIGAGEGTFNICSFWLIEAMTRAGRVDRAPLEDVRLIFEKMLQYTNHLGLFAEQIGPCGEALGNFPQAFSHIALISAAYNINKSLEQRL